MGRESLLPTRTRIVLLAIGIAAGGASLGANAPIDWPTSGRRTGPPGSVGLDASVLDRIDADRRGGKYLLVDSFEVFRCGALAH